MVFWEVSMNKIREVLWVWLGVVGLLVLGCCMIVVYCGMDCKMVWCYVEVCVGIWFVL